MSRMNPPRQSGIIAVAIATLLVVGCSSTAPAPAETASQAPAATEAVEATPTPTPTPEALVDRYPEDATIPVELVEDEYGTYAAVALDPDSELAQFDISKVENAEGTPMTEAEWSTLGVTESDLRKAQELSLSLAIEQYLDSPVLDNPDAGTAEEWYAEAFGTILSRDGYGDMVDDFVGDNYEGLVFEGAMPTNLVRDGQQRTSITGDVTRIAVQIVEDRPMVTVDVAFSAKAPATEAQIEEFITGFQSKEDGSYSYEDAVAQANRPYLLDGEENEGVELTMVTSHRFYLPDLQAGLLSGHYSDGVQLSPYQR